MSFMADPAINTTVVGTCPYTCSKELWFSFPPKVSDLDEICTDMNRTGPLCGKCAANYGPPVYSYSLNCVECQSDRLLLNIFTFIAVAFVPLTVFYILVMCCRLSVTSPSMTDYVFINQIVSSPTALRICHSELSVLGFHHFYEKVAYFLGFSIVGVWNLDFFRAVYKPFCLHPDMTTMQAIALDYAVAFYPLCLIVVTYFLVALHDRFVCVVVFCKPCTWCFARIRREWNIRSSLISAFATFLVLSYVKILNVSCDLLIPSSVFDANSTLMPKMYLYYDGAIEYFGNEHMPYGVLAIIVFILFNFLPLVLHLLYPCRCFQSCLNRCRLQSQTLRIFMDTFQGCYRHEPRDCRYFAALYLALRIASLLIFSSTTATKFTAYLFSVIMIPFAILLFVIQPYKSSVFNNISGTLFLLLSIVCSSLATADFTRYYPSIINLITSVAGLMIEFYGFCLLLYKLLPQRLITRLKSCVQKWRTRNGAPDETEGLLPRH